MKSDRWQLLIFLTVLTLLAGCSLPSNSPEGSQQAPQFSLPSLDGKNVTLKDFSNKVVVVDFWATWCGPCREEIPQLNKLYSNYKAKGFEIVGISMDIEGPDLVKQFVREFRMEYPVVMGDENVAQDFGGIRGLPTKFIIDRKGNIVKKYIGIGYQFEDLERIIKELIVKGEVVVD